MSTSIPRPPLEMAGDRWVVGRLLVGRWPVSMTPQHILITNPRLNLVAASIHDVRLLSCCESHTLKKKIKKKMKIFFCFCVSKTSESRLFISCQVSDNMASPSLTRLRKQLM